MLIGPAHTHRYRRFAEALTDAHARLAEKRVVSPPIFYQLAWRNAPFSRDLLTVFHGFQKTAHESVRESGGHSSATSPRMTLMTMAVMRGIRR